MHLYRQIFLPSKLFYLLGIAVFLYAAEFFWQPALYLAHNTIFIIITLIGYDLFTLFRTSVPVTARRIMPEIVTMGDDVPVVINCRNRLPQPVKVEIIDELPEQTDQRDFKIAATLPAQDKEAELTYSVKPDERGVFNWGCIHFFITSKTGLIIRRFTVSAECNVKVYPSVIQMREYEKVAFSGHTNTLGLKKTGKIGESTDFDQIRRYVKGDDYRKINWKATSRNNELMVNTYEDHRSQNIYAVIDLSRNTASSFEGMTYLDYSINSSLALLNTAIRKEDKAGLITFCDEVKTVIPASRSRKQLSVLLNSLYRQNTANSEADFHHLYSRISKTVKQRSLLIVYTNFDHLISAERALTILRQLARKHLVLVVLFKNTELQEKLSTPPESLKDHYIKTTGEHLMLEKEKIAGILNRFGIHTLITSPQNLSAQVLNKYLELKARRKI